MAYRRVIAAEGDWGFVECVRTKNGKCPARDFLMDTLVDDADIFLVLFDEMADDGRVKNSVRFGPEQGNIYAFKQKIGNKQVRFACFSDGNRWVLTHGFFKPGAQRGKGKWPKKEIDRAEALRKEYFEQVKPGKKK
jgi:hypothetical protein